MFPFDPAKAVTKDYRLDDPAAPATTGSLPVPAVGMGDWNWLQLYWEPGMRSDREETRYNQLEVDAVPHVPEWEDKPNTEVEG